MLEYCQMKMQLGEIMEHLCNEDYAEECNHEIIEFSLCVERLVSYGFITARSYRKIKEDIKQAYYEIAEYLK